MTSPVKKAKRKRETTIDDLPDSQLIHILSFLGVRRAGGTMLLTKRWQHLWSELPELEFENEYGEGRLILDAQNYASWINRTLDIRKAKDMEKFRVCFFYEEGFAPDVDAWVEFCVNNNVKILILEIKTYTWDESYTVPQVMYSCSSLTTLNLTGCSLEYDGRIQWNSLTDLILADVVLDQKILDDILSSCPVLNNLELTSCRGFNRLKVNSQRLNSLAIHESEVGPIEEVSAPYISSLDINKLARAGRNSLQLKNISSVVTASIDVLEFHDDNPVEVMQDVHNFLENFKHVKDVHIRNQCFQVVSKIAMHGWQLPLFTVQHLKIDSSSEDHQLSISGIICLLESSPNVETLFLNGFQTEEGETVDLNPAAKGDLDVDLSHLKKIRVMDDTKDSNGEPLLTLARILLRRAPALEEMVIVVDCQPLIDTIYDTLQSYHKSSEKAEIKVSSIK